MLKNLKNKIIPTRQLNSGGSNRIKIKKHFNTEENESI